MGKINIAYMTEAAYKELKQNIGTYRENFIVNASDSSWVHQLADGKVFQSKSYQIDEFSLKMPSSPSDSKTITENSILIYEK